MPSFATFSPELPNNVPATVLSVFGPPRVRPLWVWSSSRLISYKSQEIHYRKLIRMQHLQKKCEKLLKIRFYHFWWKECIWIIFWHWISWLLQEFNPEANHTLSTPIVSVDTKSSGMAKVLQCIAGKSAQKMGTILPLSYQPLYGLLYYHSLVYQWRQPSRHGPDFHRPQSQIMIESPDFHLRRSQNCLLGTLKGCSR